MVPDKLLRKENTGQKSLSFLGPNIWSKINPGIKNIKTSSSFKHAIKENIVLHLKLKSHPNNYRILLIGTII